MAHRRNQQPDDDDEPPPLVPGSGFSSFGGGYGAMNPFSTLGSLGSRGNIARQVQAAGAAASSDEDDDEATISYAEVTALQTELRDRFAEEIFQARLSKLEQTCSGPGELARKRQELMFNVQKEVLPKYGFEGSRAGVYKMMGAMGPYVEEPEFTELAEEINLLLGLRSPPETWRGLSRACGRASREQGSLATEEKSPSGPASNKENGATGKPGVWPADKKPPFKLFVAGSWSDFSPAVMEWEEGLFIYPMEVSKDGWDYFQLLQDGNWDRVVYPSEEDAGLNDKYEIVGPDPNKDAKSWQIGKSGKESATPGSHFVICVSLDDRGKVSRVSWEKL